MYKCMHTVGSIYSAVLRTSYIVAAEREMDLAASAALYTVHTARSEVVLTLGVSCSAAAAALAVRVRACVRTVAEFSFLNAPYCLRFSSLERASR